MAASLDARPRRVDLTPRRRARACVSVGAEAPERERAPQREPRLPAKAEFLAAIRSSNKGFLLRVTEDIVLASQEPLWQEA